METKFHFDATDKKVAVETIQDCVPILDANKELRTIPQRSDWGRHIASIPNVIITKWLNEEWARGNTTIRMGGREFDEMVARKLRDPEWKYLRTDNHEFRTGWGG